MKIRRLLMFVACLIAAGITIRYGTQKFSSFGSIAGHTAPLSEPIPAYTRALRPNYPYSVVPGGVYSPTELQNADHDDPVVQEHYADFNLKEARMVQLTEDRYQYASYRLKQKIYWTKKRLRIPKGEVLLTDGASWARARCGNRLSEQPHPQVSNEEPPVKALSMPPMELGTPMELAETPPAGELAGIIPLDIQRLQAVLPPPVFVTPPAEFPPVGTIIPVLSTPSLFPPIVPPNSPSQPPISPPGGPPIIPVFPPNGPPISAVPEPSAVYLFLVTFVISLYGLTRMMPPQESKSKLSKTEESE
jgi:hypothetical protein